jgi:hypothetical protein
MFKSRSEPISELIGTGLARYAEQIGDLALGCLHFVEISTAPGELNPGHLSRQGIEGIVYFMVPRKDAQVGRFDRATAVYQQT